MGQINGNSQTPVANMPPVDPTPHMTVAKAELGQREVDGTGDNPRVVEYLAMTGVPTSMLHDSTAWCGGFVSFCLIMAGLDSIRNAWAASWMSYGVKSDPVYGAVAARQGHVGFVVEKAPGRVKLLGGNQGNAVSEAWFDDAGWAYRWPTKNGQRMSLTTPVSQAKSQSPPIANGRAAEISRLWQTMTLLPSLSNSLQVTAALAVANKPRYVAVSQVTGVPWSWIACCHFRESSFRFDAHLHNGDPLSARTVRVPAGRPVAGNPPFTWEQSAVDVLMYMGLDKVGTWDIVTMLDRAERYNGMGYANKGLRSPYVWGGTSHLQPGMYVADGKFDANKVDGRAGVAAILKVIENKGEKLI